MRSDWNNHCAFHRNTAVRSTVLCLQTDSLPNSTVHMTRTTVIPFHSTNWGDAACFSRNRHQIWKHYSQETSYFRETTNVPLSLSAASNPNWSKTA